MSHRKNYKRPNFYNKHYLDRYGTNDIEYKQFYPNIY
jgi:hypothetical protein